MQTAEQIPARPHELEIQVRNTIRKHRMLEPGERVLVAVSGGADSMALLICLHRLTPELGLALCVAHLNHCIRGSEADEDEDFVRRISANLGLQFVSKAIEVKQQAFAARQNLEELARKARYEFLRCTALHTESRKVAVGHTLNDQAETLLLRFLRGSGLEGLSSIHPVVDGLVIRPLIECSREKILQYLAWRGVGYREDSTNYDLQHRRNRIRQELIPYLENHFNPQLVRTLAREAGMAREAYEMLELQAKKAFGALHRRMADGISIRINDILDLHPYLQKQIIRCGLKENRGSLKGVSTVHLEEILSLCRSKPSGSRILLPNGCVALRQFGDLILLERAHPPTPFFNYELTWPGVCVVPEANAEFRAELCPAPSNDEMESTNQAYLDPVLLPKVLTIRSRLPGDRYGGAGHRKVKKMLINAKIARERRSTLPLVAAGPCVVWIPGFRPARNYKSGPEPAGCIVLRIQYSDKIGGN